MYKEKINAYFEAHKSEMLEDICRLVKIKSVREPALPDMPFGAGPAAALAEAIKLGKDMGFKVHNFENYAATFEINDFPAELGILAHLDVVAEGDGWTMPPYSPDIRDGKIFGRGTADDKGPAVVALYALKAAHELNPNLTKGVRVILGTAEETGSEDMDYYLEKQPAPPKTFSPDSSYPVTNIEKGRFAPVIVASFPEDKTLPRIISFTGGHTTNIVPQKANAVIQGIALAEVNKFCAEYSAKTDVSLTATQTGDTVTINALGVGAHASGPAHGKNAQTALLSMLVAMPFAKSAGLARLQALNILFPHNDHLGEAIGIAMHDDISGALSLAFSKLSYNGTSLEAQFDSRVPICGNEQNVADVVAKNLNKYGMEIQNRHPMTKPHHTPADSDFVKSLLSVYEDYTGNKGECMAIGGGTYVHSIEGGVAFGCSMPDTENNMHGADEFAVIDELMISAKMFTQLILDICK